MYSQVIQLYIYKLLFFPIIGRIQTITDFGQSYY